MIVGVPKEIKDNENRVGITPSGVQALVQAGHQVIIEAGAGLGSGITDEEYVAAGARMLPNREDVYEQADMIMKVKEPLPAEYDLFKEGQILFTYLHLAPEPELTKALLARKVTGIAYETIQTNRGTLPLLMPMSEVAGRMSVQIGAQFLEKHCGGRGVLLGGVPGVPPAKVVIIGGGTVGTNAAKIAVGMGADVTIIDKNVERLQYLDDIFGSRIKTLVSSSYNIMEAVKDADLVIGAVLIPGAKAPKLVTEEMVKAMQPGSVIVDVAIDQGGCVETADRVSTHSNPTYVKHGVIHYAVANIPGAVARTSTYALTNVTIPYALELANKGVARAVKEDIALARGVNVIDGKVTYKAVAEALNLEYTPLHELMDVPVDLMRIA
ncbi:alanine dehydrogenase [Desulfofundulus thermocisternus]|jgi:alanine dehydrogenase|uniref:alanine dehydrogenase n=1 Tax=Desulfofundulus thermocisternus TaxID=42471 RepID=UPI0019DAEC92|nr:alanine dehydrogenase [Desulfofundulus thermocisternus]MBE3585141.1 alanine dehydrogenase [Thermoanaerobacter sp.]MCS5695985.1 alanine dehydrogenase [Desulfofundulus thermocisternus]MDK2888289.1 alanine dehydrogenase [Thermoanaerobacter sp.]